MKKGIILNAEAFGYGPSSLIAQLFNEIRPHFDYIGYIGEGHTLDLQQQLNYDDIFEIKDFKSVNKILNENKTKYQYFLSALDFKYVELAKKNGYKTALYDPLLWFWKNKPSEEYLDLYIVQDFYNTKNIIKNYKKSYLIPPIVKSKKEIKNKKNYFINFGGLYNPYFKNEDLSLFAKIVSDSVDGDVAGNKEILNNLNRGRTYSPQEIQKKLSTSEIAIMTSGLGNIFEASANKVKTIWLPPTNDSQGQQLEIIKEDCGEFIGWEDFTIGGKIDYFRDQEAVMKDIEIRIQYFINNKNSQNKFKKILLKKIENLKNKEVKIDNVLKKYGEGGLNCFKNIILNWTNPIKVANIDLH